ncbi:MAG: beta-lactamase family protein [Anaerolineae bacterium]|nr:beta-lactamase family protein [Anaerolineae bacterium]
MLKILLRTLALAALWILAVGGVAAQETTTYEDPQGRYSLPVPANWTVEEIENYVTVLSPEGTIQLHFLVLPLAEDAAATVVQAWSLVNPDFDVEIDSTQEPPSQPPVDSTLVINYKRGTDDTLYQGLAQTVGDQVYLLLFEGSLIDIQKRNAQINVIASGYTITGTPTHDLTGKTPHAVDADITDALDAYVQELMPQFKVPGAVLAIVQDGQIVYTQAYGVRELGTDAPMTTDTQMMIGSSGKSLTTTMMAALVDAGLMQWDEPAVAILPTFTMADPELTPQITMQTLVCACTGVPRRDYELIFNSSDLSAEDIVESLSTFEVFTDFGEAFQYSNQMVGTGGYIATIAGGGTWGDLFDSYAALLRDRVLDPVGMPDTTLYFSDVLARGQYATPHALHLGFEYAPLSLDVEKLLIPVAPAGGHWSTVSDMANYLIMQLNTGVAADGTRVVSEKNLRVTREPQVAVSAEASYGLGWFVETYKKLPLIEHGGNTLGFTSDVAFLPDSGLGMVVLTNAQASNTFNALVRARLFDLVFDDVDAARDQEILQYVIDQLGQLIQAPKTLQDHVDADVVRAYSGTYASDALGTLMVALEDGKLMADVGEFRTALLPVMKEDEPDVIDYYMAIDPPLPWLKFRFEDSESGSLQIVVGEGVTEYTFTPVE